MTGKNDARPSSAKELYGQWKNVDVPASTPL